MTKPALAAVAFLCLLYGSAAVTFADEPPPSHPTDLVWRWFGDCRPTRQIRLDVRLNQAQLYSRAFPACCVRSGLIPDDTPPKTLRFSFHASAAIFGSEFGSLGVVEIEGNIWQAGGDPDAIILGVSFATRHRVLLNTVHITRPHRPSQSELAEGLVIRTSAVAEAPASQTIQE
jgi:hypothetical protein